MVLFVAVASAGLLLAHEAAAQVINFSSGFSNANLGNNPGQVYVNNAGYLSGSSIQIGDSTGHRANNAWYTTPINVQAFTTSFTFHFDCSINPSECGNGFGFMMISSSPSNPTYNPPSDLGFTYSGFSSAQLSWSQCQGNGNSCPFYNAMVVKFSLFDVNTNLPGANQTGYYKNGAAPAYGYGGSVDYDMTGAGINMQSGDEFRCTITYNGVVLTETLTDTVTGHSYAVSYAADIPKAIGSNTSLVGFGAATGEATSYLYIDSWTYTVNASGASTPTYSVAAGSYGSIQSVALSTSSSGAIICYSTTQKPQTNGSTGCSSGTRYTGMPVSVGASETLYAVAGGQGYGDSIPVGAATYTIDSQVSTPILSLPSGSYTFPQSATATTTTTQTTAPVTEASISTCSTSYGGTCTPSTALTGVLTISSASTVCANATNAGFSASAIVCYNYAAAGAAASGPTFSPPAGTYNGTQGVTISTVAPGAIICYATSGSPATNGSSGCKAGNLYTGQVPVSSSETLYAVAGGTGFGESSVTSANYVIQNAVATPSFSPAAGTYGSAQSVTISDATPGTTIYYTTNGSAPTTSSMEYTGAIQVGATETLRVIAQATGGTSSEVVSATYTISLPLPLASAPTFSPAAGSYSSAQSVTISDTTSAATIYYTTDGSVPTPASIEYASPVSVSATERLQAIAIAAGDASSPVTSAVYTITDPASPVATPSFSPVAGTYSSSQTVSISDATPGATIYFTTDGTTPTTASAVYTGPITVGSTETLEAIGVGANGSAVGSAFYSISAQPSFLVGTSVSSLTLKSGQQGTVMVTITPENGFDSPVVLACSGLPAWATCSFNQSTVTPSGGAAATQLTISTTTRSSSFRPGPRGLVPFATLGMTVGLFGWRRRRGRRPWLLLAVAYAGLGLLFGCSGNNGTGGTTTTSASTSTVTVTAISGTLQGAAKVNITVQ